MFSIGLNELLIIAIVAVFIVGPRRLPEIMRGIAKLYVMISKSIEELKLEMSDELDLKKDIKDSWNDIIENQAHEKNTKNNWETLIKNNEKKEDKEKSKRDDPS